MATNLVFNGVTTRYPDIKFILSHAGGTLPMLALIGAVQLLAGRFLAYNLDDMKKKANTDIWIFIPVFPKMRTKSSTFV